MSQLDEFERSDDVADCKITSSVYDSSKISYDIPSKYRFRNRVRRNDKMYKILLLVIYIHCEKTNETDWRSFQFRFYTENRDKKKVIKKSLDHSDRFPNSFELRNARTLFSTMQRGRGRSP